MNEKNLNWIEHPTEFYPPTDILSVMKWHISLSKIMEGNMPRSSRVVCITDIKPIDEELYTRDVSFFRSLGYPTVAKIETAMLIGRELWYGSNSQYQEELNTIPLTDLEQWAEVLSVPLTEASGGNLAEAVDYTLSKKAEIWQCYIDAVKEGSVL